MKKTIIAAVFMGLITACNTNTKDKVLVEADTTVDKEGSTVKEKPAEKPLTNGIETDVFKRKSNQQFGYVNEIKKSGNETYMLYTRIDLYQGAEALEVAKKDNKAEYDSSTNKYYLPDDIYISEKESVVQRRAVINKDVKVGLVPNFYRQEGHKFENQDFEAFKKLYQKDYSWPVKLTMNEDGEVVKIEQVYLP